MHLLCGSQYGARLIFCLLPFHFGDGVGDDAGGGLCVQHAIFDDAGTDGDGKIHFAAEGQVAAGTAIDAAFDRFEFVDEFHGAHLGGAREGAGREGGSQYVEVGHAVFERTFDVRDDVLHV